MVTEESSAQSLPVNARKTDIFDVFGFKHYVGPSPYLSRGALVFRLALTGYREPLPLGDYVEAIAQRYPKMALTEHESYADLFVQTVVEVGKLDMDLHCELWHLQPTEPTTIAVESFNYLPLKEL
jgi:cyanophycin synthetase